MITKFKYYNVNEQGSEQNSTEELLKKISKLEDRNNDLEDKITELEETIENLENDIDDKEDKIYGLEDSFEKLEKEYNKIEKNYEELEKEKEQIEEDRDLFKKNADLLENPYGSFVNGSEEEKRFIARIFMDHLHLMKDYPLEFGGMLIKEKRGDLLFKGTLDKEWVDTYMGGGSSILNRLGIKD